MSSVTRLHLLSQSMLNVSCQKQKQCSSLPADSPAESPMEFLGQPRPSGACSLLGVPGFSPLDVDDDECEVVIGIRPKSSPLPRRKSSVSDEDSEPEPPLSGSRRVSFADTLGLSLVQVKEFDTWDEPKLPECDSTDGEGKDAEEFFISPLTFSLPLSTEELFAKVREQKVELETIELLPGTTILKGMIRVLNISFTKAVYIRTTLDNWSSHFDLLAEYIPGSSDSLTDCFSFKLTLVPPFGEQGARVDFCLRYESSVGTFWANNNNRNYVLFCHQRVKERKEVPKKEKVNKRSCLKTVGKNFSTVENISAIEAPSQENISTAVSEHGEEADAMKAKQTSDGQSGTSEDDPQKLQADSRRNCSRRSRRKAARMARVKDYFSQRNGEVDDTERDESPPEAKAQEEEKSSDVRSFSEGSSESQGSCFVSESLETCSKPLLDTSSPAHEYTSNSETSESVMDISDNQLHPNDEPAPAECQHINESVSKAEENNIAAKPADSVISAVRSSFTFGSVVAPLYHQVFGRAGSESDRGNLMHAGDLVPSYPHTERGQTSFPGGKDDGSQGSTIKTPNQECLDASPNSPPMEEDDETSLSEKANAILDDAEALHDPDKIIHSACISGDTIVHPHTTNNLNTHLLNPQIPAESSHVQAEAPEDDLTLDLQVPQQTWTQAYLDEAQIETQEVMTSLETSFVKPRPPQSVLEHVSDKTAQQISSNGAKKDAQTVTLSTINAFSVDDKPLEALHDLNHKCIKETGNVYASYVEIAEETVVMTPQVSFETNNMEEGNKMVNNLHEDETKRYGEAAESTTRAPLSNHIHGDMFVELRDEDTKTEHLEMEADVAKEVCSVDAAEVNWEMMVEEEERDILTDAGESVEVVEKDQGQLEDAQRETVSENGDTIEMEKEEATDWEFTAVRENKAEDADVLEYVQASKTVGEEELPDEIEAEKREELEKEKHFAEIHEVNIGIQNEKEIDGEEEDDMERESEEIVAREERELEYVQASKRAGEIEIEKRRELEKEKHFAEIQEVNTEDQDEEALDGVDEEEMEKDWIYDVEWEDQVNLEEENPDYEEGIPVYETGESEIEERANEVQRFEERSTQSKVETGLSAPVNNVYKRVINKENRHIPTEMHLYNGNIIPDLSEAARDEEESIAAEEDSCIFTDEPEIDQTSNDSASAESDSDDEVELYMHCLRAVHTGAQAQKDWNKDVGFSASKRPSVSRGKLLSTPMPSISESLDEEQLLSRLQDNHEDVETADNQPMAAALDSGQENINSKISWWKETFSCSNIAKTLLYATSLMVFLVVAYRYDFLACLGLYLISLVWLYYQGEKQPEQQKRNRLN